LVVSAGVYGTPAISQRSGIGGGDRLLAVGIASRVNLFGVGANLHDHSMVNTDRAIGAQLQAHWASPLGVEERPNHVVVADASLMPSIPSANTNLRSILIGERIASLL
jgi:choline dehydrogenase-like flavoprotein